MNNKLAGKTEGARLVWLFCESTCALFIGHQGRGYEGSFMLAPCGHEPGTPEARAEGEQVILKHIVPYKEYCAELICGITIYYKEVWTP